jgi:outer membrane protein assembly factor BamB
MLPAEIAHEETETPPRSRGTRRVILAALGFMTVVAAVIVVIATFVIGKSEKSAYEQARKAYDDKHYQEAAGRFDQLQRSFPESAKKYDFERRFSEIRNRTDPLVTNADQALGDLDALVDEYAGSNQVATDYSRDIGETYHRIADALVSSEDLDAATLAQAERALKRVRQFAPNEPIDAVVAKIAAYRERVAKEERFAKLMKLLEKILGGDTRDCMPRAQRAVRDASRRDPEFATDSRVLALLQQIRERMLSGVTYSSGKSLAPLVEPMDPTVLVVPATVSPPAAGLEKEDVVFALARGVLNALNASRGGELLWATRVGIDTTMLPVRLPATPYAPPSVLVLSTLGPDANFLTRRNAITGDPLWHYRLSAPALGRPVVLDAGRTAYVPTYDGRIHEISVLEGKLLGWFDVHQALTVGPVYQEGTSLLYVPADSRNIFVLDLKNHDKPCQAILESGHPAGSLRSEPIIVSRNTVREDRHKTVQHLPDYLVLNQADGLTSMTLKIFTLPVTSSEQQPLLEQKFNGWPWFPPAYDGERIVQVTDAGTLEVVGINQVGDEDRPLFVIEANELYKQGGATGRAQIAYALEDEYWVLAHGELQRYHFNKFGGPSLPAQQLVKMWTNPLRLGSPMHTSQVDEATRTLVLVTQSGTLQTFMATAVNMDDGQIIWQRQLGFISQGDGLALGSESVALDQGGGLFAFDSTQPFRRLRHHLASTNAMLAPSQENTLKATLLREAKGTAVYEVAASPAADEFQLIIRRHEPGKNTEKTVSLHALPVGEPALGADDVFLMLATGDLCRQPLDGTASRTEIHWRASHAQEGAVGYVAVLPNEELLVTDGTRGLMRYSWPKDVTKSWELLTTTRSVKVPDSPELPARIVSTPLVLTGQAPNGELVVLVATADGKVTLLKDSLAAFRPRGWQQIRAWDLNGKITSGPFLCGTFVACVVDHRVLVRLDPQADKPVWTYPAPESIVGRPNMIGDYVVVADQTGRYICLDPATGREQPRRGHTIRAAAGPASMPIPYGADRVLAPLNDGTILQLPLSSFKRAALSF